MTNLFTNNVTTDDCTFPYWLPCDIKKSLLMTTCHYCLLMYLRCRYLLKCTWLIINMWLYGCFVRVWFLYSSWHWHPIAISQAWWYCYSHHDASHAAFSALVLIAHHYTCVVVDVNWHCSLMIASNETTLTYLLKCTCSMMAACILCWFIERTLFPMTIDTTFIDQTLYWLLLTYIYILYLSVDYQCHLHPFHFDYWLLYLLLARWVQTLVEATFMSTH